MDTCFQAFSQVRTQRSFQKHRLLFPHFSAEVRGENTPERKFASSRCWTHKFLYWSELKALADHWNETEKLKFVSWIVENQHLMVTSIFYFFLHCLLMLLFQGLLVLFPNNLLYYCRYTRNCLVKGWNNIISTRATVLLLLLRHRLELLSVIKPFFATVMVPYPRMSIFEPGTTSVWLNYCV